MNRPMRNFVVPVQDKRMSITPVRNRLRENLAAIWRAKCLQKFRTPAVFVGASV